MSLQVKQPILFATPYGQLVRFVCIFMVIGSCALALLRAGVSSISVHVYCVVGILFSLDNLLSVIMSVGTQLTSF